MSQNSSNDKMAMMPFIENINKIEGFDPTPFAVEYSDLKTGETRKRLPVVIRLAMFRMKYEQGKIAVQVSPLKDGFVATAKVYPDYRDNPEQYLAEATASRSYCPDKPSVSPREWAQTAAVGIALRNAGFGVQFDVAGEDLVETLDGTFGSTENTDKQENLQDSAMSVENKTAESEAAENYEVVSDYSEAPQELTLEQQVEEAMKLPCPISKFNGKTLGDVLREDQNAIVWIATKFSGDEKIKSAAQLICEYSLEQANA